MRDKDMKTKQLLRDNNLNNGRTITWSKSVYREENPSSVCIFNAAIVTRSEGQTWFGDIDITKDGEILKKVANEIGEPIYILREYEAYNTQEKSVDDMIAKAEWNTTQEIPVK